MKRRQDREQGQDQKQNQEQEKDMHCHLLFGLDLDRLALRLQFASCWVHDRFLEDRLSSRLAHRVESAQVTYWAGAGDTSNTRLGDRDAGQVHTTPLDTRVLALHLLPPLRGLLHPHQLLVVGTTEGCGV